MKKVIYSIFVMSVILVAGCSGNTSTNILDQTKDTVSARTVAASDESKLPTVIDFSATWCGPCKMFAPIFHESEKKYEGKVSFVTVDIDEHKALAEQFGIEAVPTIVLLDANGKEVRRLVGAPDKATFEAAIDDIL